MRTKKALINSSVNIFSFIAIFIPNLVIRKVFLDSLGVDLLGLNSLYTNILGWLSIVELGVGSAIIYSLYKPFANNDQKLIRAYIRFYGKFYRSIGLIMLVVGVFISPFLKFFIEGEVDLRLAGIGFILFLLNNFLSYIFSHKLSILNVAQEAYKITLGSTISKIVIIIIQFAMLKIYPSFILFISIQVIVNLLYYISLNSYINKKYPWLNNGKEELEEETRKSLLKNVRAMFMHKIGGVFVVSTDNIVISKFLGLGTLTCYTNYQMVINALESIVKMGLTGLTASIGNMLSTESKDKAYDIHKKIFFISFWVVSFIVISLYNTLHQFVALWVGEQYFLDNLTFTVVLVNVYFAAMRGSVEQFQSGSGNFYQDRYAPLCEAAINFITSIILVQYIGLAGVFVGTLVSNFTVIFWTKPYVVYKYVFNRKLIEYFIMYFKYLFIAIIPLVATHYVTMPFKNNYNIVSFIINCLLNVIVINAIYIVIFYKKDDFRYFMNMAKKIVSSKI